MNVLVILSVIIVQSLAATIAPTGTTMEPIEHEFFGFYFDPDVNIMGIKFQPKCYFYTLSAAERAEVHTMDGRRKLELKLIDIVDQGTTTLTQMTKDELRKLSGHLSHFCRSPALTAWEIA